MGKAVEKVNPGRKRARFAKEFKLEAVKLLEAGREAGHADCVRIGHSPQSAAQVASAALMTTTRKMVSRKFSTCSQRAQRQSFIKSSKFGT